MSKRKIWPKELEETLEKMITHIRDAIIMDAENFSDFVGAEEVSEQCLSVANFKAVCLLKHANDAVIIKSLGPEIGMSLIENLEVSAQKSVTEALYDEILDKVPPELRDAFRERFKNIGGDEEVNE